MEKGRMLLLVYVLAVISVLVLYAYAATLSPNQEGGAVPIEDILSSPEGYKGEKVECRGTVAEKEEDYGGCEFRLEDGGYSILCIAESPFPEHGDGSTVKVTGYVSYEQHRGYWYIDVTNILEG